MADRIPASREELLRYLEAISGRKIRSRADLEAYLAELRASAQAAQPDPAQRRWAIFKHATLATGMLIAGLQYYLIHIYVQMSSMERVQFFNPQFPVLRKSALEILRLLS